MGKWLGKSFWEDDLRVLAAPQLTMNQVLYGSVYLSLENKGESLCLKDGKDGHRAGTWTQQEVGGSGGQEGRRACWSFIPLPPAPWDTWELKSCCCSWRPSRRSQQRTVLSRPPVQSRVP